MRQIGEESDGDSEVDAIQHLYTVEPGQETSSRSPPIVELDNCRVAMEVDTGAAVSIIAETQYHKHTQSNPYMCWELQM